MRIATQLLILILFTPFLIFTPDAQALPAITCHCFTERSYDTARPAAADPYLLATTQNSFFAIVFKTDKKSLVMQKQQGVSGDDLWFAYCIASKSGQEVERLIDEKSQRGSWKTAIASAGISPKVLGARLSGGLASNYSTAQLADLVVDEIFLNNRLIGEWELAELRKTALTNQELILATVIAAKLKQPVKKIFFEVKSGKKSWGAELSEAKIDTRNMQQEIAVILTLGRN